MGRLSGRIALITGAASGIGLAAARRCAEEGAVVLMSDINEKRLQAEYDAFGEQKDRLRSVVLDVTSEDGWRRAAATVEREFGVLDVLVNNAGYGEFRSIADTSLENWRSTIAVNLDSVFLGTKIMMPLLEKSSAGAIVNVSSIRGLTAAAKTGAYCAAKAGVRLFSRVTARECAKAGKGVRCNSVYPGHISTPLTEAHYSDPENARRVLERIPIGRFGRPQDIADAIVFLASGDSSYMTGGELVIDGGIGA